MTELLLHEPVVKYALIIKVVFIVEGLITCIYNTHTFLSDTLQSMTIEEAEEKLLIILKQVMEEKLTALNVEVAIN